MVDRRPLLGRDDLGEEDYDPSPPPPRPAPLRHPSHAHTHSRTPTDAIPDAATLIRSGQTHIFEVLWQNRDNTTCFDCPSNQATWVSLYLGVFLCLNCAGIHRGMGTHISYIRSATLDTWTPSQLLYVLIGGNTRAKEHFPAQFVATARLQDKYTSNTAADYKSELQKEHTALLDSLTKQGVIAPPQRPAPTNTNSAPANMKKYENATAISSDEFYGQKPKKRSCCC